MDFKKIIRGFPLVFDSFSFVLYWIDGSGFRGTTLVSLSIIAEVLSVSFSTFVDCPLHVIL